MLPHSSTYDVQVVRDHPNQVSTDCNEMEIILVITMSDRSFSKNDTTPK